MQQRQIFLSCLVRKLYKIRLISESPYVKCARILSFYDLLFATFGRDTEIYTENICIQSHYGKVWIGKRCNTNTIHEVSPRYLSVNLTSHLVLTKLTKDFTKDFTNLFSKNLLLTEKSPYLELFRSAFLRIQSKCGKIRTTKTTNMDTFCAVSYCIKFTNSLKFSRRRI